MARYDALNPDALKKIASEGGKILPWPQEVMTAAFKAANEVYAETSAKNPMFKKVYESMVAFRANQYLWFQFSEYTIDTFMMGQQRQGLL